LLAGIAAALVPQSSAGAKPSAVGKPGAKATSVPAQLQGDARILHALSRLSFGARPGDLEQVRQQGLGAWIDQQLRPESIDDSAVERKLSSLPVLQASPKYLLLAYEASTGALLKLLQTRPTEAMEAPMPASAQAGMSVGMGSMAPRQRMGALRLRRNSARRGAPQAANAQVVLNPNQVVLNPNQRLALGEIEREGIQPGEAARAVGALSDAKIMRAVESKRQLHEVMVDFWSNHFNLDVRKGPVRTLKLADDRDVVRARAWGSFRELLGASARSPAMLFYLDNVRSTKEAQAPRRGVNRKGKIARARGGLNENYARELMELHTLGVDGGYTQKDVQEVARCFTGWGFSRQSGTFSFNARQHDNGAKVVLGHAIAAGGGLRDGEQVLDILASHPSTARFLSRKLCQRLVGDEPPAALVARVAAKWAQTRGDLREVVRAIVYSPEFFAASAARAKVKSPFELAASSVRVLDGEVGLPNAGDGYGRLRLAADGSASLLGRRGNNGRRALRRSLAQEIADMGQPLFAFQAPTGYSEDSRSWVSTGGLIARLNFTLALAGGQVAHVKAEPQKLFEGVSGDNHDAVLDRLNQRLLGGAMSSATRATLKKQLQPGTPADPAKLTALVLGSPEFQKR
jgi:uncharacterized protein (DUF1800 family)